MIVSRFTPSSYALNRKDGQWVAQLDGATQSWVFDIPIQITSDSEISLDLILQRNTTQVIYGSGSSPERLYIGTENGNWLIGNGTDRIDTLIPAEIGIKNKTVLQASGGFLKFLVNDVVVYNQAIKYSTAKILTGISDLSGFRLYGSVFNFSVKSSGVLVNQIPLTNKAQGATQLATVGNVNAFMPNYTEAVWRKL